MYHYFLLSHKSKGGDLHISLFLIIKDKKFLKNFSDAVTLRSFKLFFQTSNIARGLYFDCRLDALDFVSRSQMSEI